jgi:hypothetical protein
MAVVDLGFAFLSLDDMISCVWEAAYAQLAGGTVVVAPAGNQASPIPRFPAALDAAAPGTYPNILAVGSIDGVNDDGSPHPSEFSNRGPWVSCSARGGNAHSTFLRVDMPVEEDPAAEPVSRDFTKSAWAAWNGTSFATPEVVAAIATATTSGTSPAAATKAVLGTGTPDPAGLLGIVLANV